MFCSMYKLCLWHVYISIYLHVARKKKTALGCDGIRVYLQGFNVLLATYHLIARAVPVQGDTAYQIISSRSVPTTRPSLSASPLSSAAHVHRAVPGDARGDAARIDLALVCRRHVRGGINKGPNATLSARGI